MHPNYNYGKCVSLQPKHGQKIISFSIIRKMKLYHSFCPISFKLSPVCFSDYQGWNLLSGKIKYVNASFAGIYLLPLSRL